MTDAPPPSPSPASDWDQLIDQLRRRYPGQRDSVLFCVHKLQQDPELTLPDIRDEARLHGIPAAGRALHSAKVLLGLAEKRPRQPAKAVPAPAPTRRTTADAKPPRAATREGGSGGAVEAKVLAAVQQLRSAADRDAGRLRDAIRRAIAVLQDALDD